MDNSQRSNDPQRDNAFFTAGVGNSPAEANDFEPENNLDEENWQKALEISTPVDLPSPDKIANTKETLETSPTPENHQDHPHIPEMPNLVAPSEQTPELGKIATIENAIAMPEVRKQSKYNPNSIRTTGDKLEKSSISEIDNIITELDQTGNLCNFYEEIRSMTEVNLDNSFNRKLYQDNAEGGA